MSSNRHKGLARKDADWQARLAHARKILPELERQAEASGLLLRASEVQSGKTTFPHWRFDLDEGAGVRVLDYWPSKGSWRCPIDGSAGTVPEPKDALEVAIQRLPLARTTTGSVEVGQTSTPAEEAPFQPKPCNVCGAELRTEAEAFLHGSIHTEPTLPYQPFGLRRLPWGFIPRLGKLLEEWRARG